MSCCAWCGDAIAAPAETPRTAVPQAVSHGICRPCLDHQLSVLERPMLPRGAWVTGPAVAQAAIA